MSQARFNLTAAKIAIEKANMQIAALETAIANDGAIPQLTDNLAAERRRLSLAEEVRSTGALQVLAEEVDELARELVKLNQRRQQLLEGIHGFLKMEIPIGARISSPETTLPVSIALLDQSINLEDATEAIGAAAERWRLRFKAILANPEVLSASAG